MAEVVFPGLNLQFNIDKIAIQIGPLAIHWYAILVALDFALAMLIYRLYDGKFDIKFNDILDLSLYLIPISLISARAYYILFNLDYYISNPMQILNTRSGGMAIYGGIIGGAITCYIFCKKRKINLLDLLDYIVPCLALGQALGRIGNFINVEGYGTRNFGSLENGHI